MEGNYVFFNITNSLQEKHIPSIVYDMSLIQGIEVQAAAIINKQVELKFSHKDSYSSLYILSSGKEMPELACCNQLDLILPQGMYCIMVYGDAKDFPKSMVNIRHYKQLCFCKFELFFGVDISLQEIKTEQIQYVFKLFSKDSVIKTARKNREKYNI